MGALREFRDRLVGQLATPDAGGGPYLIIDTRLTDDVLYVIVETPDGPRQLKAHECWIFKPGLR
jgi:hypothetical protein